MKIYEVEPYIGIGPIKLGMTRQAVRELLGEPSTIQNAYENWGIKFPDKDYYYESCFQISYSEIGCVNFIEVFMHAKYSVVYLGLDVHRIDATRVIAEIGKVAVPDAQAWEYPLNQDFPDIDVRIYREEMDRIKAFGLSVSGSDRNSDG